VFTTHTPVAAGHDRFPQDLVERILGDPAACGLGAPICHDGRLNMTYLALTLSHYVNGVAKRHGEVARQMFGGYEIDAITNGVHAGRWVSSPLAALFDRHVPGWREDNSSLRYTLSVPDAEIWAAHREAKQALLHVVNRLTNAGLDLDVFTIGFARRATAYKRPDLLFDDLGKLRALVAAVGPVQVVYAGKAHPRDEEGKRLIQRVFQYRRQLAGQITVAYVPDYNIDVAKLLTAGVDLWLNTPQPPLEASGTSGMKAALNGVPSLSVLDGWWIEGCIEGVTGWAIGEDGRTLPGDRRADAASLYEKLERLIVPTYYRDLSRYLEVMRHAFALNGSFFNTQRMMQQYVTKAYFG
jgi:starch phosphorylase